MKEGGQIVARSIKCPHCGKVVKVHEEAAGKRVDCPECHKAFRAPQAIATPEKPTEAAAPPPAAQPPPAPTGRVWYFHLDGRNDGPHTPETVIEQIRTGRLDAKSLVWKEGMGDWKPLAEVQDFRGALSVPPPVSKAKAHPHAQPGRGREREPEHEQHARYSRSKARRDLAIGLWVAGGLGFAALVVLIVVLSQKEKEDTAPAGPKVIQPIVVDNPQPQPSAEPKVKPGPQPRPKVEASNQKLLTDLVADLDSGFTAAIEGHKKANRRPIDALIKKCRSHAEKLAAPERQWGGYKDPVDSLVALLNQGANGMQKTLAERSVNWGMGESLDDKQKDISMRRQEFEWLTNWRRILADAVKKIRDKGLDF